MAWTTRGRCPGALAPMEGGDGLLLRVRPRSGALKADALATIARVSRLFGNGAVELTRRANLQIRGVRDETLAPALTALARVGLLDRDESAEAVRNILVSPLAGLDSSAALDGTAIAAALEAGLLADSALAALPAKFSFLVDEGGRLPLSEVPADIRIEAEGHFARLSVGGDAAGAIPAACVEPCKAAATALALARGFLRLAVQPRSMRELVETVGIAALAEAAGIGSRPAMPRLSTRPRTERDALFGPQSGFCGVGAAFGVFGASQLEAIAALAPAGVRPTPWRALLLPGVGADQTAALAALGLVTAESDPRLAVAACPGHPACLSGEAATRPIAETLAKRLPLPVRDGIALHVSGCAKGCAHTVPAPYTLVGNEGRFDLVLDGRARDPAILSGLNAAQAEGALATALSARRALAS